MCFFLYVSCLLRGCRHKTHLSPSTTVISMSNLQITMIYRVWCNYFDRGDASCILIWETERTPSQDLEFTVFVHKWKGKAVTNLGMLVLEPVPTMTCSILLAMVILTEVTGFRLQKTALITDYHSLEMPETLFGHFIIWLWYRSWCWLIILIMHWNYKVKMHCIVLITLTQTMAVFFLLLLLFPTTKTRRCPDGTGAIKHWLYQHAISLTKQHKTKILFKK